MGSLITYEEYMNMLSERVLDNSRQLKRTVHQRRNGMEDLYGVCFSANGDAANPATFYISLSPDYVYLERFAFKFVIRSFVTTVTGGTDSATVQVDNRTLNLQNDQITPNPHNHGTRPHTHNIINGISHIQTTSDNFSVRINNIDITPYLIEQQGGAWISGEGIYPNNRLDDIIDFYDILDVASMLNAEGNVTAREKLLAPEFKKVEILSDAPFGIDAYLYMKYTNLNR